VELSSLRWWQSWLRRRRPPLRWLAALLGSVRATAALAASIVVTVVLVVALGGITLTLRTDLYKNVVNTTKNEAYNIVELVRSGRLPAVLSIPRGDLGAQVVAESGQVISHTPNVSRDKPLMSPKIVPATGLVKIGSSKSAAALAVSNMSDSRAVFVAEPVVVPDFLIVTEGATKTSKARVVNLGTGRASTTFYVFTLASLAAADQSIAALGKVFLVVGPLLVFVVGYLTWLLVGRAFRPVEQMRRDVDDITVSNLARRIHAPEGDDEIARLARTMNLMLDRLESSVTQQKQFIADASHELKSPLSALRTALEVGILHPEVTDWPYTASLSLAESTRMQRLIEDLLLLAKSDANLKGASHGLIDLDDLCREEVARLRRSGVGCQFDLGELSSIRVYGDSEQVRSVVRNLLENASRYAVRLVSVGSSGSQASSVFWVQDDGPGIPPDKREAVFERFTRLDPSRTRSRGGSGLGLAIVKSVTESLGGEVRVTDSHSGQGARFEVRFPKVGSVPPALPTLSNHQDARDEAASPLGRT